MDLRRRYQELNPRERQLVIAAGAGVLLLLLYAGLWQPLQSARAEARERAERLQQTWAQLQSAAVELRERGGAAAGNPAPSGESLLALVDRTARQGGLATAIKRVEPDSEHTVRVWLEDAAFDDMIVWLGELQKTGGVSIVSAVLERQPVPGRVNVRLVLGHAA